MTYREIPETAIEVQTGLWWDYTPFTYGSTTIHRGNLYASEGYCFYDIGVPENLDEEGNLVPPEDRLYAVYGTCIGATAEEVTAGIFSVPYQEGYEVVSVPSNPPVTE